ncbi:hypothetical protein, partial [Proteus faecis]|uniref:hypothetical protein n=1 Tax=Proteus faecis TaxID=2050967 RepID=UPI003075E417
MSDTFCCPDQEQRNRLEPTKLPVELHIYVFLPVCCNGCMKIQPLIESTTLSMYDEYAEMNKVSHYLIVHGIHYSS